MPHKKPTFSHKLLLQPSLSLPHTYSFYSFRLRPRSSGHAPSSCHGYSALVLPYSTRLLHSTAAASPSFSTAPSYQSPPSLLSTLPKHKLNHVFPSLYIHQRHQNVGWAQRAFPGTVPGKHVFKPDYAICMLYIPQRNRSNSVCARTHASMRKMLYVRMCVQNWGDSNILENWLCDFGGEHQEELILLLNFKGAWDHKPFLFSEEGLSKKNSECTQTNGFTLSF